MFCRERAVRIATFQDEILAAGGRLVAIGNGTPAEAQAFAAKLKLDYPVYTDPDRQTYLAMKLPTKLGLGLSTPWRMIRAVQQGFIQGRTQGNAFQQGGEAVFSQQGEVLWSRISQAAGSHASDEEMREAIKILVRCESRSN